MSYLSAKNKKIVLDIARQLGLDRVLLDPEDRDIILAVREQVQAEHGFFPMLDSDLQRQVINAWEKGERDAK